MATNFQKHSLGPACQPCFLIQWLERAENLFISIQTGCSLSKKSKFIILSIDQSQGKLAIIFLRIYENKKSVNRFPITVLNT